VRLHPATPAPHYGSGKSESAPVNGPTFKLARRGAITVSRASSGKLRGQDPDNPIMPRLRLERMTDKVAQFASRMGGPGKRNARRSGLRLKGTDNFRVSTSPPRLSGCATCCPKPELMAGLDNPRVKEWPRCCIQGCLPAPKWPKSLHAASRAFLQQTGLSIYGTSD